ncbi:MAG: Ig-like domain-containing protein [Bacteroidales bacterium]|nr:Ig-like domain-containing protein [Bacteroidales bacterium]
MKLRNCVLMTAGLLVMSVSMRTEAAVPVYPKAPADGQRNVPVNSQIVLQSDEALINGTDSCFLNGELLPPASITGSYAIIKPGQLRYATVYTLNIKDGAFLTKDGQKPVAGGTYTFTTVAPTAKVFDAIVAADGTGDYTSIRAAVKAAPQNRTQPWLIFVKNGEYVELVRTSKTQPYISLVGEDPEKTVLKFSITSNGGHERDNANFADAEGQGPVLVANAPNFYLHNMTVIDSWGYDNQAGPQALALGSYADRFTIFNAKLKSYQDTWQTGSDEHRHYARRCYIEGAVDFIYCSGDMVLDSCTLGLCRNGSVIVAPSHGSGVKYGYVFRNCNIVSSKPGTARTNNYFGRPWHNFPRTSFINTTLSKDITFATAGWINHMGGLPVVFAEYNTMNYQGTSVNLKDRNTWYWRGGTESNPEETCTAKAVLTKEEADALTARTVLSGSDGWNPYEITVELPAPQVTIEGNSIVWTKEPQAICYEVIYQGSFKAFTTETSYLLEEGSQAADYRVRAVNMYGTLGLVSAAPFVDGIQTKRADTLDAVYDGNSIYVSGFEGKAQVSLYSVTGSLIGRFELENGVIRRMTEPFFIAKIVTDKGVCVLKAVL